MTEEADDILMLLPARLKEARQALGLSLESVANLSGVSRSMVSQIERGESSPTISTLWNLTRALQVDFAGLLDHENAADRIELIRAGEVPRIDNLGQGVRIRILSPPEEAGKNEVYDLRFDHQGALISKPHGKGAREQLLLQKGQLEVRSGSAAEKLEQGDIARYAGDVEHSIVAPQGPAHAILIVSNA